jgi:hypothetical protein
LRGVKVVRWLFFVCLLPAVLVLAGCSLDGPAARNDQRMRGVLSQEYPGFRIMALSYYDSGPFSFPAPRVVSYSFRLESQAVPSFVLYGTRNLEDTRGYREWGPRRTMFDRSGPSAQELIELERLWVRAYPGVEIWVGDDSLTGRVDSQKLLLEGSTVATSYARVPLEQVYQLAGDRNDQTESYRKDYFFRLDPSSGHWTHLTGFIHLDWE